VTPADLPYPAQYDLPFSEVQLLPDRLDQPLRWRRPRRIFVDSMADLFHEDVPEEFIDRVFAVMALSPQHTFQVLTKRPERMHAYMTALHPGGNFISDGQPGTAVEWRMQGAICEAFKLGGPYALNRASYLFSVKYGEDCETMFPEWPLPNVWLGVSCEDQATADERIPLLLETPAAVHFISAEPLLGPIDLTLVGNFLPYNVLDGMARGTVSSLFDQGEQPFEHKRGAKLDWVIVGGESGRNARPMDHAWARSIREQCRAAGVAFFGKQHVSPGYRKRPLPLADGLGDQEWPEAAT